MPTSRPGSGSRSRARPPARRAAAPKRAERYGPARRLGEVQELLNSGDGASVYDVAERFRVSVRTALRYIRALQIAGEPLYEEMAGRRKVWRVMTSARPQTITLTTAQMVALFLSRRVFDFLAGTGFKEDLDEVFAKLEAQLRRKDLAAARNLGRKVFDVNEARHIYEGRIEDVNDIVTALLREDRLRVTHESVSGGKKTFVLEPYTLMVYKKGLYLVGLSHQHGEIRTFALDAFREVEWLRGEKFQYPADYRPEQVTEGAFGLIRGESAHVRVLFDPKVARFVERVMWHPTQKFRRTADGLEMTMDAAGTVEISNWVLGFGDLATVLSPPALRTAVADQLSRALDRYRA
jgi:predicted DNA-binding transcriptional regulator YafY